jgi:hypothetical protein
LSYYLIIKSYTKSVVISYILCNFATIITTLQPNEANSIFFNDVVDHRKRHSTKQTVV